MQSAFKSQATPVLMAFLLVFNFIVQPVQSKDLPAGGETTKSLIDKLEAHNKKLEMHLASGSYTSYLKKTIEETIKEYKQKVLEFTRHTLDGNKAKLKATQKRMKELRYWLANLKRQLRIKNITLKQIYEAGQKDASALVQRGVHHDPKDKTSQAGAEVLEKREKLKAQIEALVKLKDRADNFTGKKSSKSITSKKKKKDPGDVDWETPDMKKRMIDEATKTSPIPLKEEKKHNNFGFGNPDADMNSVMQLIRDTINPSRWLSDQEKLVKFAKTPEGKKAIESLEKRLHDIQRLQMPVEIRFIIISDQFFERIGIDFDFDIDDEEDDEPKGAPPAISMSRPGGSTTDSASSLLKSVKDKKTSVAFSGDGATTSSILCSLTNETGKEQKIRFVPGDLLAPNDENYQTMMVVKEKLVELPAGKTIEFPVETFCVSPKTVKPPPPKEKGVEYQPAYPKNLKEHLGFLAILATSLEMASSGAYSTLMIPEKRRTHTIGQLAVWKEIGENTDDPDDNITHKTIRDDIMKKSGKIFEELPAEQQKGVDKGVAAIFAAVDLTQKTSKDSKPKEGKATL